MTIHTLCFKFVVNSTENETKSLSEVDESHILIHSLRDANLPKFLAEDVPLFERILDDLFPSMVPPDPDHGIIEVWPQLKIYPISPKILLLICASNPETCIHCLDMVVCLGKF